MSKAQCPLCEYDGGDCLCVEPLPAPDVQPAMKPLRVTYAAGMVNVNSDDICFGWIPNMYTECRAGIGLQVNAHLNRNATERMCIKIAEAVAEFYTQNVGSDASASSPIASTALLGVSSSDKRRIKQNAWGNWYGYEGSKRVKAFAETPEYSMEQNAEMWRDGIE